MRSILAVAVLVAMLSLCNLTGKEQPTENGQRSQSTPAPSPRATSSAAADREAVKAELMRIEDEMTNASFAGDISTLARDVADNYSGTGADGSTQNKNQLLAATKPDKTTKSWKIEDAQLVSLSGDSAVLTYVQSQTLRNGQTFRARITDTFVKQNGRWLVQSEQQTLIK